MLRIILTSAVFPRLGQSSALGALRFAPRVQQAAKRDHQNGAGRVDAVGHDADNDGGMQHGFPHITTP